MIKFKKQLVMVFLFGFSVELSLNNTSNSEFNLKDNSITLVYSLRGDGNWKYPRNFDKNFDRIIIIKGFPDSKKRIKFDKSELEFYNSARLKLYRVLTLNMKDKITLLSSQKHDTINYVTGQGFYRFKQDFRTESNMFTTR